MDKLPSGVEACIIGLARTLIDQESARILVPPQRDETGFWFGGGDMIEDADGGLVLVGRYRNYGDSRTGLGQGERGLECALFRAPSFDRPFEKVISWSKAELTCGGRRVTSIEGTSLRRSAGGIELFISSEKDIPYPDTVRDYQKPGTGVWSIDRIVAAGVDALDPGSITKVLASEEPVSLHLKDPVIIDDGTGDSHLVYCVHPFTWSCAYSGLAVRREGTDTFKILNDYLLPRGHIWDVAAARITGRLPVPRVGALEGLPPLSLYFYDGAECLREHGQNAVAVRRPRGYSCEELGGLAWGWDGDFPRMTPLSITRPHFVSPYGTGCSRYVSVLKTSDALYATWQQSQPSLAQALVGHSLPLEQVAKILTP